MTRLLPAHVLALALMIGLAGANLMRLESRVSALFVVLTLSGVALVVPPRARLPALAVLAATLGWMFGSARLHALDRSALTRDIGRAGHALVEVTGPPRTGMFEQRLPGRVRAYEGRPVGEPVQLELPLGRSPPQGALIDALVVVRAPRGPKNGFDERTWLRRQGIHVVLKVDRWSIVGRRGGLGGIADGLRRFLERGSAPGVAGERRAVLEGILLGDETQLSDSLKTSFQRSGLFHLLAVSGENVVLLAAGVLGLAWLLGLPRAAGHAGALAAIVAYVLAVGPQPSVIRAAVSGGAVSVAWLLGRQRDQWHVLLLAAIALLAWNPYTVFDAGFQLSFAAVLAIFVFARPLLGMLEGYPGGQRLHAAVAISLACSVVTAPLLALQFGRVPLLGVIANALAEAAVGPLLALAFGAALLDPIVPCLAELLAGANAWVAAYIALVARAISAIPFAQASGRAAAWAAAGLLVAAAYAWRRCQTT
ncbi:MAG TPA: ComEC/Rec2 family competence protein [Gaiellaceae bacterium]|nr:ComEC/Rec2 family competence protein [Gaiellaceae bacterium]